MSVKKITLTDDHIKLLKHLQWSVDKNNLIVNVADEDYSVPFNSDNLYEAIDLILNGMPPLFDPFNTDQIQEYTDEQKAEWDKLYSELPLALSVILQRGSFETGKFKAKYHDPVWKKIN